MSHRRPPFIHGTVPPHIAGIYLRGIRKSEANHHRWTRLVTYRQPNPHGMGTFCWVKNAHNARKRKHYDRRSLFGHKMIQCITPWLGQPEGEANAV